jgi:TatD DNase family protein
MLVDSHCHLDFPELSTRLPDVLLAAAEAGVGRMVTISTHVRRFETYRTLAEAHPNVFCTVGTHPHNAAAEPDVSVAEIIRLSAHPRCVAVGESGLDYHYDKSPRAVQKESFRTHIAAARESALPLVIHARDADADLIDILREEMKVGRYDAVLHCFSSGADLARVGVELGFYVSFSGILTFKNAHDIRRIAAAVPRDRVLVETDAPYLAPEPRRGRGNEPAFVTHTAGVLAAVMELSTEEVARITTENFYRLFRKAAAADGVGQGAS